jgi:putative (di)nucleoside polyphosphate hydrolase
VSKRPSKAPAPASSLDDLIADPIVQLTLKADRVAEGEFRELLRAAGWRMANRRAPAPKETITTDGASAITEYRRGAGIMLLNRENRVFIGRRRDTEIEAWQMPQGGIEPGEEPLQAAYRELQEEIGTANAEVLAESVGWHRYDLPPNILGRAWHGRWRGQLQKWFVMRFLGEDTDINVNTVASEFSAWKWVTANEISDIVVEFKRQLYIDLLAEFGDLHLGPTPLKRI